MSEANDGSIVCMMYGSIVFCIVFQLRSAVEPPYLYSHLIYIPTLHDENELNGNELIEK